MTIQNKQLTVYLSKSLLTPKKELDLVRNKLTKLGFNVTEYKEGTVYSDKLLKEADFVVFVTLGEPVDDVEGRFETFVGKGQYTEASYCYRYNKLAFIFHEFEENSDDLLVSKIPDKTKICPPPITYDVDDWKIKFGKVYSFVSFSNPIYLYPFIENYFNLWINEYPLTPKECYPGNYKLLLLK